MKRPTRGIRAPRLPKSPFKASPSPTSTPAAPRRFDFERLIGEAIDARRLLSISYDDDFAPRTFQPSALYHSTSDKVCVTGIQIRNPAMVAENGEPRVFEVGKMRNVAMTDHPFTQAATVDRFDKRYAKGIIKSV